MALNTENEEGAQPTRVQLCMHKKYAVMRASFFRKIKRYIFLSASKTQLTAQNVTQI